MSDNAAHIREFIEAWPRMDPAELAAYFTEDGVYHNIPIEPVAGRQNVERFIAAFVKNWTATNWDIVSLAADGDTVIAERVDHIHAGDKSVDLPCVGVFQMQDGKIKVWRDYFDMGTYAKAMR